MFDAASQAHYSIVDDNKSNDGDEELPIPFMIAWSWQITQGGSGPLSQESPEEASRSRSRLDIEKFKFMQEDLLDVWKISCLQFFFSLVFFDPKNGIISLDILELFITSNIIEARRTWLWIWPGTTRAAGLVFWKHFQKWPIVWWMDDVIDGWDLFLAETLAATQNDLGGVLDEKNRISKLFWRRKFCCGDTFQQSIQTRFGNIL